MRDQSPVHKVAGRDEYIVSRYRELLGLPRSDWRRYLDWGFQTSTEHTDARMGRPGRPSVSIVQLVLGAGNRDDDQFGDPDNFDPGRKDFEFDCALS